MVAARPTPERRLPVLKCPDHGESMVVVALYPETDGRPVSLNLVCDAEEQCCEVMVTLL